MRLCIFFVFAFVSLFVFVFTFEDFPVDCEELVEPGGSSVYQVGLCTLELGRHERSFLSIYTITSAACPNLVLEIAMQNSKKNDLAPEGSVLPLLNFDNSDELFFSPKGYNLMGLKAYCILIIENKFF